MIKFLMVGSHPGDSYHSGPVDGAVVKHSFNLAWRILDCLPPSVDFFQKLLQDLERQHLQVTVSKVIDIDGDKVIVTVIVLVLSPVTLRSNHNFDNLTFLNFHNYQFCIQYLHSVKQSETSCEGPYKI